MESQQKDISGDIFFVRTRQDGMQFGIFFVSFFFFKEIVYYCICTRQSSKQANFTLEEASFESSFF